MRDRKIPVLSFDFLSGKSMGEQSDVEGLKLTALVAHDSHSGSLTCFPLKGKDNAKHAVHEMVKYLQYLGHGVQSWLCSLCFRELGNERVFEWLLKIQRFLTMEAMHWLRNQLTGFEVWLVFC